MAAVVGVPGGARRSPIWKVFDEEGRCCLLHEGTAPLFEDKCGVAPQRTSRGGGTQNMWQHLRVYHEAEYSKQQTAAEAFKVERRLALQGCQWLDSFPLMASPLMISGTA